MSNVKKTWRVYDQWHTTSFDLYSDTREWRHLLKLNPSFDIRYSPAPGTRVYVGGDEGSDQVRSQRSRVGGLLTSMGTTMPLSQDATETSYEVIYPWESFKGFSNRLGEYTAASLLGPDRINGYALDSPQTSSDTQRG